MLNLSLINQKQGPDGLPTWLSQLTNEEKNPAIALVTLNNASQEHWRLLGNVLLEKLIMQNDFGWIFLDGTFSPKQISNWVLPFCQNAEDDESKETFFFKYLTYVQPNYVKKTETVTSVEWLSFSKTNVFPLESDFFKSISKFSPVGCDIFIASPTKSINVFDEKLFTKTNINSLSKYIGNWISPIEDYYGYYFAVEEGEPLNEIINEKWLQEELIKLIG